MSASKQVAGNCLKVFNIFSKCVLHFIPINICQGNLSPTFDDLRKMDRLISFILEISPVSRYYYIGHLDHRIDGARSIGTKKGKFSARVFFFFPHVFCVKETKSDLQTDASEDAGGLSIWEVNTLTLC